LFRHILTDVDEIHTAAFQKNLCNLQYATTYLFLKATVFFTTDSSHYSVHKSIKVQLSKNE